MLGLAGVTAIEVNAAAATRRSSDLVTPLKVALIVEVPVPTPVARPAVVMVATVVVAEAHVTELVRFCVELSVNVPVAVNCCVVPLATLGLAGVTAIEVNAAAVTVSTVEPVTPLKVALIVEVPVPTPVARPAVVMVATLVVALHDALPLFRF